MRLKTCAEIQIRDPFVLPDASVGVYYLFGSTDADIWGPGTGFDAYTSRDLIHWEGPFPVFRPSPDFFSDTNFWAPEVYAYEGQYIMFATFRRKDNGRLGTAVLAAAQPLGPYKLHSGGPVTPEAWSSLDGTLYLEEQKEPWMVFCHEWQQVRDGEICAMRLNHELTRGVGEPKLLFRASEAPWTTPYESPRYPGQNYVTDGPFLHTGNSGRLYMLWAGFVNNRYALGAAWSESGSVLGPWKQNERPLYSDDGGHGMLFRTFDGRLMLALHAPNRTPLERPIFLEAEEREEGLVVTGRT